MVEMKGKRGCVYGWLSGIHNIQVRWLCHDGVRSGASGRLAVPVT